MKLGYLGAAVVGATILMSAAGASAFQFINPDTSSDGSTIKLVDPDQRTQSLNDRYRSGGDGPATLKFGSSTLQFGMSGRDNRYAPSPWMQERFLQSPASRTVPSQGW